jgi:probable HAF family extracellular repeat protein
MNISLAVLTSFALILRLPTAGSAQVVTVDLGTLGGTSSAATAVNDNGQVVGASTLANGSLRAFLWTATSGMLDLGALGGRGSHALAVNGNGQVVGLNYFEDGSSRAFSWTAGGGMVDLGTLGGRVSGALQ